MATVTPGIVWVSGETVTPAKLNSAAAPTVAVADNEITTAKILDANVTQAKLAANVAGNGPAFRAYAGTTTTVPTGAPTKLSFNTENFDTNSNFADSRFTPTVAGYYQINASAAIANPWAANATAQIYKNGAKHSAGYQIVGTTAIVTVSDVVYCNGTTDYVEIYGEHVASGSRTFAATQTSTFFSGGLIRAA
jgi:hypothetical protein